MVVEIGMWEGPFPVGFRGIPYQDRQCFDDHLYINDVEYVRLAPSPLLHWTRFLVTHWTPQHQTPAHPYQPYSRIPLASGGPPFPGLQAQAFFTFNFFHFSASVIRFDISKSGPSFPLTVPYLSPGSHYSFYNNYSAFSVFSPVPSPPSTPLILLLITKWDEIF